VCCGGGNVSNYLAAFALFGAQAIVTMAKRFTLIGSLQTNTLGND